MRLKLDISGRWLKRDGYFGVKLKYTNVWDMEKKVIPVQGFLLGLDLGTKRSREKNLYKCFRARSYHDTNGSFQLAIPGCRT